MKFLLLRAIPLALALGHPASAQSPPPVELSAQQWRDDLAFMVAEMKRRHPDLYHRVSQQRFDAAVADLDARIPGLQRNQVIAGMMRIAAMVGDGHTRVDPRKDAKFGFPSLPLKLYLFEDGLFIRAAKPEFASLVGAEVLAVGGTPVAEAIARTHAIASVDNEIGYRLYAPLYLAMPDVLHALGLSGSRSSATLKLRKDGRTWTVTVAGSQVDPPWPPDTDISLVTPEGWVDGRTGAQPLWLESPLDYHRLKPLPERQALYAQINMIAGIDGQSLAQFGEKIRKAADEANPRAVVLDLRLSTGGNHDLRHRFIREMVKTEDQDTRLFVLTWRGSFSATEALLVDLDRLTDAVFIGEPASSKPNSFGDAYRMPLPNSGISIRTSIQWNQLKGQSQDPWTWVDVAAPYRFADYAAGRDPALEAAFSYAPRPRLSELALKTRTPAELRKAIDVWLADPANRYANRDIAVVAAAEALFAAKRIDEGLDAAQLATARSPRNLVAQLTLAILAERAGRLDLAADAGERALAIDPNDRQARSLLERVRKPG